VARKYFGTDGIRGRVGEGHITPDFALKLGWAGFASWFGRVNYYKAAIVESVFGVANLDLALNESSMRCTLRIRGSLRNVPALGGGDGSITSQESGTRNAEFCAINSNKRVEPVRGRPRMKTGD